MTLPAGTKLDHYEIRALIGQGGMGEVYLAQDLKLKRTVALKILSAEIAGNAQCLGRFQQEARTASLFSHPNMVHIYEIGEENGVVFIAMEHVEGESLRKRIARAPLSTAETLDIATQLMSALTTAHAVGIVHRDIKSDNIMIGRDGYVKVLDFGLAKPAPSGVADDIDLKAETISQVNTSPGTVMGTVSYMSPEQARGHTVDARADLWSVGVVLYEMLTGRLPFEGPTPNDVIASILRQEPPPVSEFHKQVPETLEWMVAKTLTKEVEDRYQTARELLADMQRLSRRLSTYPSGANEYVTSDNGNDRSFGDRRPSYPSNAVRQSSAEYLVQQVGRHKKLAIAILTAMVIFVGVAGAAYWRYRSTTAGLPAARSLARLSFEAGLQIGPTWSPDGQFVAYASDRKGNFDIWVQQVGGGTPIQVTSSPAHDWQPDWSPDGKSIVFRSERDGGGLFVVPAYGGLEKKISSFGYHPMWSPDGSQILTLQAGQRVYDFPKLFVVKVNDPRPREIPTRVGKNKEEGVRQGSVAWYPDGKRVSFFAMDGTFWTVSLEGGQPVQSVFDPELQARLKEAVINFGNFRWAPSGKALYLEGWSKGVLNLWRVSVDPDTLRWIDGPERLTTGTGQDTNLALTRDGKRLAFSTVVQSTRVWMLPFDIRSGRLTGPGQPITPKDVDAWFLDVSRDGTKLVYLAHTYGTDRPEMRVYSVAGNTETVLAGIDNYYRFFPRWSPDATRLAFSRFQVIATEADTSANPPKGLIKAGPIVLFSPIDKQEQFLTSPGPWLDYMGDWSPDGRHILASSNRNQRDRWEICLFPLSEAPHAETAMRVVASDPEYSLWTAKFSPDGRWISYIAQKVASADASILYVVPAGGGSPVRLTATDAWADWPRWAPDGKTLYYVSSHNSGFLDVWGIKFDPEAGKPIGEPFRITNYDNPSMMIATQLARTEMAFSEHSLALPLQEVSGSIWMLDGVDR